MELWPTPSFARSASAPMACPTRITDGTIGATCPCHRRYQLNAAIAASQKPQVSIWDGFCMGGGAGISVHGAFRIATEKTVFAMPETNIGMFPDVGASSFLSTLPGSLGPYLALTGARLGPADVLYTGLATHYIPSSSIPELIRKLEACDSAAAVRDACDSLAADPGTPPLAAVRPTIDRCFVHDSVEEILAALRGMPESDWAQETLVGLHKMSPTACKVRAALADGLHRTLRGVYRARFCTRPPACAPYLSSLSALHR